MIRNDLYTKYLNEISELAHKLGKALEQLPDDESGTMEENEIYNALYWAHEKLIDAKRDIKYFSNPNTKEGYLHMNRSERFELYGVEFRCGSPIEVYLIEEPKNNIKGGWHAGRVEARNGEYYFFGANNPSLYDGMRVRVRNGFR